MIKLVLLTAFGLGACVLLLIIVLSPARLPSIIHNEFRNEVAGCYGYSGKAVIRIGSNNITYMNGAVIAPYDVIKMKPGLGILPRKLIKVQEATVDREVRFNIYNDAANFIPISTDGKIEFQSASVDGEYIVLRKMAC